MEITAASPVEIDEALAEVMGRIAPVREALHRHIGWVREGQAKHEEFVAGNLTYSAYSESYVERLEGKVAALQQQLVELRAEAAPFEAEFERRGGWTRAFIVRNSGGHIHSSMNCASCYPTTVFGWLPQVSGHAEAEIVEQAGEGACTVCYPSAPAVGKRTLLHAEEVVEQAAREERARAKAEKVAKAAAKAIIDPETGEALRGAYGSFGTEGSAQSEYVEEAAYIAAVEAGKMPAGNIAGARSYTERFLRAAAAKHGVTVEEHRESLSKKVAARVRRDYGA